MLIVPQGVCSPQNLVRCNAMVAVSYSAKMTKPDENITRLSVQSTHVTIANLVREQHRCFERLAGGIKGRLVLRAG